MASAPKYVLLATNTQDVFQFDLQYKLGSSLLKETAASLSSKPK